MSIAGFYRKYGYFLFFGTAAVLLAVELYDFLFCLSGSTVFLAKWELAGTWSMPPEKSDSPVVFKFEGWTFRRNQFEQISKDVTHGVFSADELIEFARHLIGSDDQYTKYGSEVAAYIMYMSDYFYVLYKNDGQGLVTPEEIIRYYIDASNRYKNYNSIRDSLKQQVNLRKEDEAKVAAAEEEKVREEEEKKGMQKLLFYGACGFAGLLVILSLIKRKSR
jgi:hypothetical protein